MKVMGLILAAGLSRRMGEFKPLMRLGAKTLLEQSIDSLLAGGAERVVIVLGFRADDVARLLRKAYPAHRLLPVLNPAYASTDMLASIQIGLRAMPPCDACLLLPGDMPAVSPDTMRLLADTMRAGNANVVFPMVGGFRKHPPLIRASCIRDILSYRGEGGLRGLWRQYGDRLADVPVSDEGCLLDADTAEDFQRLTSYFETQNCFSDSPLADATPKTDMEGERL